MPPYSERDSYFIKILRHILSYKISMEDKTIINLTFQAFASVQRRAQKYSVNEEGRLA